MSRILKTILVTLVVIVMLIVVFVFKQRPSQELQEESVALTTEIINNDILEPVAPQTTTDHVLEDLLSNDSKTKQDAVEPEDKNIEVTTDEVYKPEAHNNVEEVSNKDPYDTYVSVEHVPIDRFNLLQASLFDDEVFEYSNALHGTMESALVTGQEWKEWRNNFLNIVAHIESVKIKFATRAGYQLKEGQAGLFTLEIVFEERPILSDSKSSRTGGRKRFVSSDYYNYAVVARHSRPKQVAQAGGARLKIDAKRQTRYLLEGVERTSIVILVPKGKVTGPRGMMFCPRDYDLWKARSGVRILEDSGYEIAGVSFIVRAVAEGRVSTGFGPGYSETLIQTTPNIPVQALAYDQSRSIFPFASVEVMPASDRVLPGVAQKTLVTGGIKTKVLLQNSLNHKAVTEALARLTVRKIKVHNSFSVPLRGKQFRVDPGDCYALVKDTKLTHTFSKEKLVFEDKGEKDKTLEELVDGL